MIRVDETRDETKRDVRLAWVFVGFLVVGFPSGSVFGAEGRGIMKHFDMKSAMPLMKVQTLYALRAT